MTSLTARLLTRSTLLFLTLLIAGSSVFAQSLEPFTVRIDRVSLSGPSDEVAVNVTLAAGWANLSGFEFLIAYENGPLRIRTILPGDMNSRCDWEYFSWRAGRRGPRDEYNRTTDTVRVTAAAQLSLDHLPACYTLEPKPITLFTMHFQVRSDREWNCLYSPIRFYWRSCYDNRISVPASIVPFPHDEVETIAQRVFEPTGWEITRAAAPLPTWFGPHSGCVSMTESSPVPYINLVNGGVILSHGCPTDRRGDINLNGAPYEIEDSWIFAKYLIFGDSTLRNPGQSLLATDMNRDRRPGTIEDLVLLMRAVLGEYTPPGAFLLDSSLARTNPFVPPTPRPSRVKVTIEDKEMSLRTDSDTLVAARLVFAGHITPHLYNNRLDLYSADVNGETRLLIYGFFTDASFGDGPFMYWEGNGRLISAEMATSTGGRVEVSFRR